VFAESQRGFLGFYAVFLWDCFDVWLEDASGQGVPYLREKSLCICLAVA
jgi:hypothetical protein